jgi:serine protease Do
VVGSYDEVDVVLSTSKKYLGKVIGRDADTDLAVVKIETSEKLPSIPWADIGKLKVGQWVIAVGNPFGLDRTVTVGIISGLGREDVNLSRYENFIQTDASINPGNSGGPLLNIRGEMIGINTAIINFAQGIGFAIPTDMVQYVVNQILEHGKVARGWLGIGIQPLTRQLAQQFDILEEKGVLVSEVFEGGPADPAGIRAGDVILKVDDKEMLTPNTLSRVIGTMPPQKMVELALIREGEKKVVAIKLGERESERDESAPPTLGSLEKSAVDLGIEVRNVTQDLMEKYNLEKSEGVVITRVEPGSLAEQEGLRSGDLIVEIGRQSIENIESFNKGVARLKEEGSALLRIMRDNRAFYLVLSLLK